MYHVLVKSENLVHRIPYYFPYLHGGVVWCGLWTCCEEFDDPFGGIYVGWAVVILVMQIQPRAQGERVTQGLHHQNRRQKAKADQSQSPKSPTQQPIFYFLVPFHSLVCVCLSYFYSYPDLRFLLYSFLREQR